jgi:hypothetical protein
VAHVDTCRAIENAAWKGRAKGKHGGTTPAQRVLEALLWRHRPGKGLCLPYEAIAEAAHYCRRTIADALARLSVSASSPSTGGSSASRRFYGTATPRQLLNNGYKRSGQMIYTEPRPADTRRFARIRRLSMGQWIGLVAGACALVFGIYFFFSYV